MLVNHGTASSAEIVTAALKQRGRATIVGTHTYGKGVFQEIQPLSGGGRSTSPSASTSRPTVAISAVAARSARRRHHAQRYAPTNARSPIPALRAAERVVPGKIG